MTKNVLRGIAARATLATCAATACGLAGAESLSREYKLPLQNAAFADVGAAGPLYAQAFAAAVQAAHGVAVDATAKAERARQVSFLDTPGSCALRKAGFILRLREDDKRRQLTLKTRSADATWVRATRLDAAGAKNKLEEDVSAPGRGQLSRSSSLQLKGADAAPADLAAAAARWPVLQALPAGAPLAVVQGQVIHEQGHALPRWRVAGVEFEGDLSFWRDAAGRLLFSEVSFRYEVPQGESAEAGAAAAAAARAADALFQRLQADTAWAGSQAQTKTDFIYKPTGASAFCD